LTNAKTSELVMVSMGLLILVVGGLVVVGVAVVVAVFAMGVGKKDR
jgi:hypothetical protein